MSKPDIDTQTPINRFSIAVQELETDLTTKQFLAIIELAEKALQEENIKSRLEELESIYVASDGSIWHTKGYKLGDKANKQYENIRIEERHAELRKGSK